MEYLNTSGFPKTLIDKITFIDKIATSKGWLLNESKESEGGYLIEYVRMFNNHSEFISIDIHSTSVSVELTKHWDGGELQKPVLIEDISAPKLNILFINT